jgi:hypothetical protein
MTPEFKNSLNPCFRLSIRLPFRRLDYSKGIAHASTSRRFTNIVWRRASQMRAVLSDDAVTMRDPSGLT